MIKTYIKIFIAALCSILLLVYSWPPSNSTWIIFFAFVPILYISRTRFVGFRRILKWILIFIIISLWIWFSTKWIYHLNSLASIIISIVIPTIFILPFIAFAKIEKEKNVILALLIFVLTWVALEYLISLSEFGFPYLLLGNSLAVYPKIIQWYQFTGVLGGSLWIISCNSAIYCLFLNQDYKLKKLLVYILIISGILIFPIFLSLKISKKVTSKDISLNVVALHTKLACPRKYEIPPEQLLDLYIENTKTSLDSLTDLIIWPENALTGSVYLNAINNNFQVEKIKSMLREYPNASIISGIIIREKFKFPNINNQISPSLKYSTNDKTWYLNYNGCIFVNRQQNSQIRTKQKLVPFEEGMPYPKLFSKVKKYVKSLGKFGFISHKDTISVFASNYRKHEIRIFPIICYEAVFGNFCRDIVDREKSNLLSIIFNEGWQDEYQPNCHFVLFSVLRAIENQRSVIKSSNNGISCFIYPDGTIINEISEKTNVSIKSKLPLNDNFTFYTKHGDYIGELAIILLIIYFILRASLWKRSIA